MNDYGIAVTLNEAYRFLDENTSETNKTTLMLERYKGDDRIVFPDERFVKYTKMMAKTLYNKDISYVVVNPKYSYELFKHPAPKGNFLFHPLWVELYYLNKFKEAEEEFTNIQKQFEV